jgi:hypothetical protein
MSAKRVAVVTASNDACGDFVIAHWLRSLRADMDLSQVDVVVLDYGLSRAQRRRLDASGVRRFAAVNDGFIGNLRFRDVVRLLDETPYERLLVCDGGDLIFQSDVGELFAADRPALQAALEEFPTPFYDTVVDYSDVRPELRDEVVAFVRDKPMFNVGVVVGTAEMFRALRAEYERICCDHRCYGSDQLVFNYFAYSIGMPPLDARYNFVLIAAERGYEVRDGVFYDDADRVIPIVHNAGGSSHVAVVDRFGFGPRRNRPLRLKSRALRLGMAGLNAWNALIRRFSAG